MHINENRYVPITQYNFGIPIFFFSANFTLPGKGGDPHCAPGAVAVPNQTINESTHQI